MSEAINQNMETLPAVGSPPKARVRDASSALAIIYNLIQGRQESNRKQALLQGMLGGNPPYSQSALRSSGQAYRSNFPSLEGKSIAISAMTPFYDLFASGKTYADVKLHRANSNDQVTQEQLSEWSRIVTAEFDRRLKSDTTIQIQAWKLIYDFVCFGRGHVFWEKPTEWAFRQVPLSRVLFPDATNVDPGLWDYFAVRQEVPVHWLWSRIRNEKVAADAGWNIEACRQAIRGAVPDDPERGWTDYLRVQQELQDNDLYVSSRSSVIKIANLYVKEFDGRWSHLMVCENFLQGQYSTGQARSAVGQQMPTTNPEGGTEFLYRKTGAYGSTDEFISTFYLDVCTGSINGLTGVAHDIYSFVMVKDRMLNTVADNTFFRSALIVQAQTPNAAQEASVTLIGNMVVVPSDLSIQSSQVVGDVETTLGVIRDFDARIQNNTGVYRPQLVKPTGNPRTATEAELNYSQAATLTASSVNRFYDQLDLTWAETYRRMSQHDTEFRDACRSKGVPLEVLTNEPCVRSARVIGAGSMMERRQAVGALMSFYNQYPAGGQRALLAAVTAAYTDQDTVTELMPKAELEDLPTRHHWEATQENAAMLEGAPVIWTPEQNDLIHAQVHLGAAVQALQSASPESDLPKMAAFCDGVAAHCASTHLPRLQASNPEAAKVLEKTLRQVLQGAQQLKQEIAKQQQEMADQQARAQQLTVDQQLDRQQAMHKMQLSQAKTEAQLQMRAQAAEEKSRLAEFDLASRIKREDAAAIASIQRDNASTAAEINQAAAKTASEIRLNEKKAIQSKSSKKE